MFAAEPKKAPCQLAWREPKFDRANTVKPDQTDSPVGQGERPAFKYGTCNGLWRHHSPSGRVMSANLLLIQILKAGRPPSWQETVLSTRRFVDRTSSTAQN